MLPTFLENLDVGSIHVYSPRSTIFVCGGKQSASADVPPSSIRDALLRAGTIARITRSKIFIVEEIQRQFLNERVYGDFYEFENDMAQICDLVFLISESPGSFTELGSFTRDDEVAKKLFTVIRQKHFDEESYISVGPIRYLDNNQAGSVFVIPDDDYKITDGDYSEIDHELLGGRLRAPVSERMERAREHTQFNRGRNGHLCKLLTALVQEFGALEMNELIAALEALGIADAEILAPRMVFCAKTVEWVRTDRRGLRTFILPNAANRSAKFQFADGPIPNSPERRRVGLREYWRAADEERYAAIIAGGAEPEVGVQA